MYVRQDTDPQRVPRRRDDLQALRASVSEEVSGIDGVSSVDVELATGAVTVVAVREIGRDEVGAALSHAGFALAG